jgi:hypothetical protein
MIVEDLPGGVSNICNSLNCLVSVSPKVLETPKKTFFMSFIFSKTICSSILRSFAYGRSQRSQTDINFPIFNLLYFPEDVKGKAIPVTGRGGP